MKNEEVNGGVLPSWRIRADSFQNIIELVVKAEASVLTRVSTPEYMKSLESFNLISKITRICNIIKCSIYYCQLNNLDQKSAESYYISS